MILILAAAAQSEIHIPAEQNQLHQPLHDDSVNEVSRQQIDRKRTGLYLHPMRNWIRLVTLSFSLALVGGILIENTVAVFLTVVTWGWLWGIAGALVAVPVLIVFKVVADNVGEMEVIANFLGAAPLRIAGKEAAAKRCTPCNLSRRARRRVGSPHPDSQMNAA